MTAREPRWGWLAVGLCVVIGLAGGLGPLLQWLDQVILVLRGPAGIFAFAIGGMVLGTIFVKEEI